MKVIVISGASSKVGKTTLAMGLQGLLEGAVAVKIGHGKRKDRLGNHFYQAGTPFHIIRENHRDARWLIIESNSILCEIQPDLAIYLEGENPKPSAEYARARADIVSGRHMSREDIELLAARLETPVELIREIAQLARAECDPPLAGNSRI